MSMKLKPTKIIYEPLPHEDFLLAKVTRIEVQSAEQSKFGQEQLKFELTILSPEEVEDKKVAMWFNPLISSSDSKKASKLRTFIEAADPGALDEVEENDEEYDVDDLIGKRVRLMMEEPVADKFQKVATVRSAKKSAAEKRAETDEEDEAPKPKAKAKPAEDDESAPKAKAKKADPDEDEDDRPAAKAPRKRLTYKR